MVYLSGHDDSSLWASAACLLAFATCSLLLLGPRAYSLDARIFGRREIIIPQAPRTSEP